MLTGNFLFLKEDRDLLLKKQCTFVEASVTQKAFLELITCTWVFFMKDVIFACPYSQ